MPQAATALLKPAAAQHTHIAVDAAVSIVKAATATAKTEGQKSERLAMQPMALRRARARSASTVAADALHAKHNAAVPAVKVAKATSSSCALQQRAAKRLTFKQISLASGTCHCLSRLINIHQACRTCPLIKQQNTNHTKRISKWIILLVNLD